MDGRSLKSDERLPTLGSMQQPIKVDLPHKLGRDEARRRIANNIHKLKDHIPGRRRARRFDMDRRRLDLTVHAMGQAVETRIGVEETKVRVEVHAAGNAGFVRRPDRGDAAEEGQRPPRRQARQ